MKSIRIRIQGANIAEICQQVLKAGIKKKLINDSNFGSIFVTISPLKSQKLFTVLALCKNLYLQADFYSLYPDLCLDPDPYEG